MAEINPLSNPKGVELRCELCAKPAYITCTKCRVTYYCDEEHQNIDWVGIHERICQLLVPLRMPVPFTSGSEKTRVHQREQQILRQQQMIELTRTTGQKLLFEEKYEYAVSAAMQSLKTAIDLYGLASIELVPSYLILGEACIGLGRFSQAEDYLSQAKWTVLKTPECSNELKYRLHQILGMLYAGQGNSEEALKELAEAIYQSTCAYDTDDIKTSGGYFHMANIFYQQDKLDVAYSIYDHLLDIWNKHLSNLVTQRMRVPSPRAGIGPAQYDEEEEDDDIGWLDDTQGAEAAQILHSIQAIREKQSTNQSKLTILYYTLGMLYVVLFNYPKAIDYCSKAAGLAKHLGPADKTAQNILALKENLISLNSAGFC